LYVNNPLKSQILREIIGVAWDSLQMDQWLLEMQLLQSLTVVELLFLGNSFFEEEMFQARVLVQQMVPTFVSFLEIVHKTILYELQQKLL